MSPNIKKIKIIIMKNIKCVHIRHVVSLLLYCLFITPVWSNIDEQNKARQEAANVFAIIEKTGNYGYFTAVDLNNLPMGLQRTISNVEYTVAISAFEQENNQGELTIYGRIKTPQKELFFGAKGIKCDYNGDIIGETKLLLLGDISIPINGGQATLILHGGFNMETGVEIEMTYMTIDCSGFKELNIMADVVVSDSLIRKVDNSGEPISGAAGKVSAPFHIVVSDWSDILVSLSLPRFEINGLDGFIFDIKNAVFDFSDSRNETGIQFPDGYETEYLIPGNATLWKGLYIRELSVVLPKQFARRESSQRVSFAAKNMLLDNNGISGSFAGNNILPIDQGSAGGWKFSVNTLSLKIRASQLVGAGFAGVIGLPVAEVSELAYEAFISPNNEYMMNIKPVKDINFDIWMAKATVDANSYVKLTVVDGKFRPEAMLNGSLSIAAKANDNSSGAIAEIGDIKFTGMHLQTVEPYFSVQNLGYEGTASLKGFPLSISKINLTTTKTEARLSFDAKLSLSGDKSPITADTRLEIVCLTDAESKWKYKKLDISKINVGASLAEAFSLKGDLTLLNNDPVYGDGFSGTIELRVTKGMDVSIVVNAIFGKKDYRYWYVDGLAEFPNGIVVFPTAVKLAGFGGGAYYRMKSDGKGNSPTGMKYVPDDKSGLGLKAAVLFNICKKGLVDGEASFEIAFNKNGGMDYIGFFGQAKFMGNIPGTDQPKDFVAKKFSEMRTSKQFPATEKLGESGFAAAMSIEYDFTQNSLHATFDMYINAANGTIKGTSSGNRAGWAVFHTEPGQWYIYMGTPKDRMGIKFSLTNAISMATDSYFMMGNTLPNESPEVPQKVLSILNLNASDIKNYTKELNSLANGGGVAFGSSLSVSTGDITFLIVYASFNAGLGFDIMLKDYQDAQCKGRSGTIGIDGWYANGQAYAYLQGEVGVNINLLFIKKKIPIIKGATATLLQAGLPNPSWFTGYLSVQFDLLGGLVKGNVRLKLAIGEKCEIMQPGGSPLDAMMIGDITPSNGSKDVDVFAAPQVAFNMPIGESFEMEDDQGIKKYKLNLEEFSVSDKGKAIDGKIIWNNNNDAVSFFSHEILLPNTLLKVTVRIRFEEWTNNRWLAVSTGGQIAEEKKEITFTTGAAPDIIPLHNIEYCYPVIGQRYYYPKESTEAYIQLKRGQSYLFTSGMSHKIRISKENSDTNEQEFNNYNTQLNRIAYTMPLLAINGKYEFDLLSFAKGKETGADTQHRTSYTGSDADNDITVRDAKAGQVIQGEVGKSLLNYKFSSSAYNTFAEKFNAIVKGDAFAVKYASDVINLQYEIKSGEPFDVTELVGTEYSGNNPLLKVLAVLDDDYFKNIINPLIYADYPPGNLNIKTREREPYGIPPSKAVLVNSAYRTQVENNNYNDVALKYFPYIYDLPRIYKDDYIDLRGQIINRWPNNPPAGLERFYQGSFPFITFGYYNITLQYVLPGKTSGTKRTFIYYNPIK
jgi:hypothetical protein